MLGKELSKLLLLPSVEHTASSAVSPLCCPDPIAAAISLVLVVLLLLLPMQTYLPALLCLPLLHPADCVGNGTMVPQAPVLVWQSHFVVLKLIEDDMLMLVFLHHCCCL